MATTEEIKVIINGQDNASGVINRFGSSLDHATKASNMLAVAVGAIVIAGAGLGIKFAAEMETATKGLETLLGSSAAAGNTVKRIKEEAARTPFEIAGLTKAVQLMASVTKDGDKAIKVVLDVGEGLAAMGKGQAELDRISVNLQQIAALGKASSLDIKQFAFAGIPIYEMLTKQTGLAGEALGDFITNGGVTFDLLTEMFDKANDAGGRFFNAYINQTGTLNQLWSNFKDTLNTTLGDLVVSSGLFDLIKGAIERLTVVLPPMIQWLREHQVVLFIIAGAIVGALVPAIYALVVAFGALMLSLAPFILIGAVIGAVIYGIVLVIQNWGAILNWFKELWMTIWTAISDFFKIIWETLMGYIRFIIAVIVGIFQLFGIDIVAIWQLMWTKVSQFFVLIWNGIKVFFQGVWNWLVGIFTAGAAPITNAWSSLWNGISGVVTNIWNTIKSTITAGINWVIDKIKSALAAVNRVAQAGAGALGVSIPSIGNIPRLAKGGIVTRPTLAMVGESGPEAVVPLRGRNAAGGGTVINITGTFMSEDAAEKMGDLIIGKLKGFGRI